MAQPSCLHPFWLFRRGRRRRFLVQLSLAVLALSVAALELAAVANAHVPATDWKSVSTLEGSAPPVLTLIQNRTSGVLYASTAGGVFRSRDDGASWQSAAAGLTDRVATLAVDDRSGAVYAGTWDGVLRSVDEGEHWLRAGDALRGRQVVAMTVDSAANEVYARTIYPDTFSASEGGTDWRQIEVLTGSPYLVGLSSPAWVVDEQRRVLYTTTTAGIWQVSSEQGWLLAGPSPAASISALALEEKSGTLYAGADSGVFRSQDGGATWQAVAGSPDHVHALIFNLRRGALMAATDTGVYRLTVAGARWEAASLGLTASAAVESLGRDDAQGALYVGTVENGLFRSVDDGATWESTALLTRQNEWPDRVWAWAVDSRRGHVYASRMYSLLESSDRGLTWQEKGSLGGLPLAVDEAQGYLYQGSSGKVFRTPEDVISAPPSTASLSAGAPFVWQGSAIGPADLPVWTLEVDERNGAVYAGTSEGVYRSSDHGLTWVQVGLRNAVIWSSALDAVSGALYVGPDEAAVYRSVDGGENWERLGVGLPALALGLVWEAKTRTLLAGTEKGVFRYDDQAGQWVGSGLAGRRIQALVAGSQGYLYAGTDVGVYRSEDGGLSWEASSQGLGRTPILALAGNLDQGQIYAGTRRGVFSLSDGGQWEKLGSQAEEVSISQLREGAVGEGFYGAGNSQMYRISPQGSYSMTAAFGVPIWGLAVDQRRQAVYVAASSELDRSLDGGQTWAFVGSLPRQGRALVVDDLGSMMYATDFVDVFYSSDDGRTWQDLPGTSIGVPVDYLWAWNKRGAVGRWPDGSLIWTAEGMQALWQFPATFLEPRPCLWGDPRSGPQIALECSNGAVLLRAELETLPLPWLALRLWSWEIAAWLADYSALAFVGLALALIIVLLWALIRTRRQISRPFGVPVLAVWFAPQRLADSARPAALAEAWPRWEKAVRTEMVRYGDACLVDMEIVPGPFRRYALQRYAELYADTERLDVGPGQIRMRDGGLIRRWWAAAGLVDTQARLFADALGTSLGEGRDLGWATIYLTGPLNLAGQPPASARLIWLAESSVGVYTVQALRDLMKDEVEALTLIVSSGNEDETEELRQALAWLSPGGHVRAIGELDMLGLLIAREPLRRLAGLFTESAL